jgi:phenylpropionate dioxygenase-like ring-hydroxylating dioxygenase large terminal subunit
MHAMLKRASAPERNMPNLTRDHLHSLIEQYQSGKTLPQEFYVNPDVFDYEMAAVLNDTWFFARHSSELSAPGNFAVVQVGGVSLLLLRGRDGVVRGFHNVCMHRSAKLCTEAQGSISRITCPYHSWSYALDGQLVSTQFMPADFKKEEHSLRAVSVAEDSGLIYVNLDSKAPPLETLIAPHRENLRYHGIPTAQVALRRTYLIRANWKLTIENFTECYHCAPSHQTLTKVMSVDRTVLVRIDPSDPAAIAAAARVKPKMAEMEKRLDAHRSAGAAIPRAYREFLAPGYETGALDGKMLLPPMTPAGLTAGTESFAVLEPHTGYLNLYEDYTVLLSYLPQSLGVTALELTWLVKGAMPKPDDEIVDKLAALWDITSREDAWLSENTVAGVHSPFYRPGTLSNAEIGPRAFLDWYIQRLKDSLTGGGRKTHVWAA